MMRKLLLALAFAFLGALPALAQNSSIAGSQVAITPNSGAYSAGLCLGGIIEAPGLVKPGGPGGAILNGVTFLDLAHQTAANDAMSILVFNVKPTGTYTDHANCQLAAGDVQLLVGVISIAAANCVLDQGPTNTVCTVTPSLSVPPPVNVYTLATSAGTAVNSRVLTFSSVPAYIVNGMVVADVTASGAIVIGSTVVAVTSTTVTISNPVTATTVGSGDTISFTQVAPTKSTSLWFVPFVAASPTYGSNKVYFTFMTAPVGQF